MEWETVIKIISKWINGSFVLIVQNFLFIGFMYLIFYAWKNKTFWVAKIQKRYPKNKHVIREIRYSIYTIFIIGGTLLFITWATKSGLTLSYSPIAKYGYVYYVFSIAISIFVHDAYFYWTHRFLHWKPIFKYAHKVHHLSTNPTPFAAFSFHPIEAVFQVGIYFIVAFTIPHHISIIYIFSIYSLVLNVYGHTGFEFFPKWVVKHKILKWHNTATHHNMHHTNFKTNFGLYFNFWDRVMKTNHPKYEEQFEKLADLRNQAKVVEDKPAIAQHKAV